MQLQLSHYFKLSALAASLLVTSLAHATPNPNACLAKTNNGEEIIVGSGLPGDPAAPESSTGYRLGLRAVSTEQAMVVSANPYASKAGCEALLNGGTAIDAAVAVQLTLGLVEPQSSGIGGGGFLLYYDASNKTITAYDGRERAPSAATPDYLRFIEANQPNSGAPVPNARRSGRSIGTPGTIKMLELAHQEHGKRAWPDLIAPAKILATEGFKVSPRLAELVKSGAEHLKHDADASAYFFDTQGAPIQAGTLLKNPAYATTLEAIATQGSKGFYQGPIAQAIVNKVRTTLSADGTTPITPGLITLDDLANYQPTKRTAVCSSYRERYEVCGMPPPSSGGIAVAQALSILEQFDLANYPPSEAKNDYRRPNPTSVHLVSEALNLAFADRNRYVSDWDSGFNQGLQLPSLHQMLDKTYLHERAKLVSLTQAMTQASPGTFPMTTALTSSDHEGKGTTHISIVDPHGNAVSFTTTIEGGFGSYHMTQGFLLNNELTDFSIQPEGENGPVANRIEANKRPRSSMAPTLVFSLNDQGKRGELLMVTGSPGGSAIIQYTLKTIIASLDWNMDAQQATGFMNFGASNGGKKGEVPPLTLESDYPGFDYTLGNKEPLALALQAFDRPEASIKIGSLNSGVSTIVIKRTEQGQRILEGGVDPRREGLVLGF